VGPNFGFANTSGDQSFLFGGESMDMSLLPQVTVFDELTKHKYRFPEKMIGLTFGKEAEKHF
jgi:hypothetical protein